MTKMSHYPSQSCSPAPQAFSLPSPALPGRVDDLVVDHHARVLVLEDVAVEQVQLLLLEVVGELYDYPNGLPWPDEDGVLPPQISDGPALLVHRRPGYLLGAVTPLEHPEPEAVEVH